MLKLSPSDRQIGLFGGSFNPPHFAHLVVAELIGEQFALDRVIWIPNYQSPLKKLEDVAPAHHRLAMTRLAVEGNDRFDLTDIEARREDVSYTVETLRTLQKHHPNTEFRLIIGSDSLATLAEWHEPEEILERVRLIVFRRPGATSASAPEGFEDRVAFADAPLLEISGTSIRNRIHSGRSVRYMVPEAVRTYIFEHGLYGA